MPLLLLTVTDRTSAPWMTLEVKQAKVERRIAERKWRQSGLTVHKEIYAKQRNLVSNLIRKAKKGYICEKIVNCDSSRELLHSVTLSPPQTFPQSLFLISLVSFLLVRLNRLEAVLTLTGQSPLKLLCSLGLSLRNFSP